MRRGSRECAHERPDRGARVELLSHRSHRVYTALRGETIAARVKRFGMPPKADQRRGPRAEFHSVRPDGRHVISARHTGPCMEIDRAFDRLVGRLTARQRLGRGARSFAIFYDDPSIAGGAA